MWQKEQVIEEFQKRGKRMTQQRRMLLEVILESDWTNCKDIYYEARKRDPNLGMATVYRTVSALEEMGVLARTSTPHRIRQRRKRIVNSNHLCLIDHYFRVWHQKLYEASGFRLLRIVRGKVPQTD